MSARSGPLCITTTRSCERDVSLHLQDYQILLWNRSFCDTLARDVRDDLSEQLRGGHDATTSQRLYVGVAGKTEKSDLLYFGWN